MSDHGVQQPIQLDDVSLCYRLAKQKVGSLKEYFIQMVSGALQYEDLWALDNLNLTIEKGETVGVVGPNGAGKSTLAKVVAGVLKPTRGKRQVNGVIAPLLELGTGFDPELTGYENIYLNALLLGRRRREIDEKIDEIIQFSGLKDFIYTPVRNYSSGMVARLGFAVATGWIPDILILDEVLAVGDVRFLRRCEERLHTFRDAGTTILLVSHSSYMIEQYSTRCIWLDKGKLIADGEPAEILARYAEAMEQPRDDTTDANAGDLGAPEPNVEPAMAEAAEPAAVP